MEEMRVQAIILDLCGENIETVQEMARALGVDVMTLIKSLIREAAREYRENLKDAQYEAAIWLVDPALQEKIRAGSRRTDRD